MTDIFVYCPTCNEKDGKETLVETVKIVNGTALFKLKCGHTVIERFRLL